MSLTWRGEEDLVPARPAGLGWALVGLRASALLALLGAGLAVMLLARLVEGPLCRPRRPVTPWITVGVCRVALRILGLRIRAEGAPDPGPGVVVANHSSWLDIFALNAQRPVTFLAKSEVAGWAGIGWLARATGTLFVRREARSEASRQAGALAERLRAGERLLFFPEGTSTDNRRVLPFRTALFEALFAPGLPHGLSVQPVTLSWQAPEGRDPRFHAWYGAADLLPHALAVLSARPAGGVTMTWHASIPVEGRDRKSLARAAEEAVRSAL
jgi:1-acyl-sn-glycerol-3-phosphate acyltransferase